MNYLHRQALSAQLADLVGQRIVRAELADDGGAVSVVTDRGELVILAQLQRTRDDVAPELGLDWQLFTSAARP